MAPFVLMSKGSVSDIPLSGISSEEEKSAFTEELSRNSGVLIDAEQDKNDELVVSDLEEEGKVESEHEDFPGFEESSEDTLSHLVYTDQRTETSITASTTDNLCPTLGGGIPTRTGRLRAATLSSLNCYRWWTSYAYYYSRG
eukprot:scaffold24312_cov36-Attheya_sp.AAC.1